VDSVRLVEADEVPTPPTAGWYADPFGRLRFRWWDGGRWTEYAGDAAVQWDPGPVEEVVPTEPGLPGLGVAAVGCALAAALAVGIAAWLSAAGDPGGRPAALVLSELGLWGALVGSCVFVSRRRGSGSLIRDYAFRFRWLDLGFGLAGSLVGRAMAGIAVAPIPFPSRSLRDADRSMFGETTHGALAWTVLVVVTCVGAPLVEELFFRGLVQTRLVGRHGPVIGIVVASLVFGAAHLLSWSGPMTLAYAWAVAAGGLVLGTIRHLTGRLGPGIVAHALFNLQAVLAVLLLS
jgi:membrane protease YdiL (CAAX protease family)